MQTVEYERITSNIAHVAVNGAVVRVSWKCPATGRAVLESTSNMVADPSVAGRVRASVKRSIASEVINGAARFLAGILPGAAGRIANNAVYTAAADVNSRATAGADYSETSRRQAIVAAFASVKDAFIWDEKSGRYIAS